MANKKGINRSGYREGFVAILSLLVVIAIIAVLFSLDFGGPRMPANSSKQASRPWLLEELIVGDDELIKMPKRPKPTLAENVELVAQVSRNDEGRGTLDLEFTDEGVVVGRWECGFMQGDKEANFQADLKGNIDVKQTYVDKKKQKDKTLLYFITRGKYSQVFYDTKTGKETTDEGFIYATGYLGPDYSVKGLLTLTADKKASSTYEFESGEN